MLIIDGHLDHAWNALQWNRDLLSSVYTIRVHEKHLSGAGRAQGTVALPEMRKGRIALCFATLLARSTGHPVAHLDYPSPLQAHAIAQGQLAYYRALEREGHVCVITRLDELERHVATWEAWDAQHQGDDPNAPPLGFIISMEGADPILAPEQLSEWWDAGLRIIGPAHYGPGRYTGGTGTEIGFTNLGVALLDEMARLGMFLDLTHLSDQAFWQAIER